MNRPLIALGLAMVLAGCTASTTPSQGASAPSASISAQPSSAPAVPSVPASPSALPGSDPTGLVAYGPGDGIWVVDPDGTDAHELLPDVPGYPIAWSGDGSRLLYSRSAIGTGIAIGLTDAAGSKPETYDLECPVDADTDPLLYSCKADGDVAISPDGTRLAYPIREGSHEQGQRGTNAIAVLELSTGLVTKLESTQITTPTPTPSCGTAADQGENRSPSWSPDGTRLVFIRDYAGVSVDGHCQQAILTVSVDGSDLRQIVAPSRLRGDLHPSWSPDGSSILLGLYHFGDGTDIPKAFGGDIHIVGSDGSGLHALTSDGVSIRPSWTRDGRVVFTRWSSPTVSSGHNWVMDADSGNARQLETTIPALTAAGCMVCSYPMNSFDSDGSPIEPPVDRQAPLRMWEMRTMLWQPVPADRP